MSKLDPSKGTTEMIIKVIGDKMGTLFGSEDELRDAFDNISIEDLLKALIADSDIEEVQTLLDLIKKEDEE